VTRHIFWQAVLALLGIGLISLILFQVVSTPAPAPEPTPEPAATIEVPAAGGTYVEGVLGFSEAINPILAPSVVSGNSVDQDLSALVFDGLTSLDPTGRISPSLAVDWDVSEDGTVYVFRLQEDVRWHDGAPFTAADVAFTIQAMQDPDYRGDPSLRDLWRNVQVEQLDTHTVQFALAEPFPSFMQYTTIGLLPAHLLGDVPAADLPDHEFSTDNPVGTGMFKVEEILPDRVVLASNADYWGKRAYLDGLEFWFYPDWERLLADYEQGVIHGFHPPQIEYVPALAGLRDLNIYAAQLAGYGMTFLNLTRDTVSFLQEKEVRQALLYALDRQALIDRHLAGQGLVADSPILPMMWAYDSSVRQYGYDPERAIGLLDASGWMDSDGDRIRDREGIEMAFTFLVADEPAMVSLAEGMADQWAAVGVNVTVRPLRSEALVLLVRDRQFDAALVEVRLTGDPDPYPLWHSTQVEGGQNVSGFVNAEADAAMEEIRATADPEERLRHYHQFQQIFAEEVPSLLIYYPIYTYAVDQQVHEVQLSPLFNTSDRFRSVADWYVQTAEITVTAGAALDKTGE
jgi:peptide/nickel transport system substrate-binding protein